jgi:hypothetical protein
MLLPGGAWHDGHMGMATEGEKHDPWRNGGMTFDVACTLHLYHLLGSSGAFLATKSRSWSEDIHHFLR